MRGRPSPVEQARLPEVVTIFYRDGPDGAVDALRRYLESVSTPPPAGWDATPPAVFKKSRRDVGRSIQSLNVIKKATTSSICSALRTGLPRHAGATRTSPSDR